MMDLGTGVEVTIERSGNAVQTEQGWTAGNVVRARIDIGM